jgi:hypothetical protein
MIPRPARKQAASRNGQARSKAGEPAAHKLKRQTLRTSRELDFLSQRELVTQTGHEVGEWPLVIVKELLDNALDACDEADIPPAVDVTADAAGITVTDNGPGLPDDTLAAAMDFSIRASSREAYVAPDRGAQGNALKTLLAMPRLIDPAGGRFVVTAHGRRHVITCGAHPISQRAVVQDDVTDLPICKNPRSRGGTIRLGSTSGTEGRIEWTPGEQNGQPVWPFGGLLPLSDGPPPPFRDRFRALLEGFALFNPHATITLDWFDETTTWPATDTAWPKWKPHRPTSPHWYDPRHLERLIGGFITADREAGADRFVSDFVGEFHGLSGSQKRSKVLDEAGMKRVHLSALVTGDRLDRPAIEKLRAAMIRNTRPVTSEKLGSIGDAHLRARLLGMGVKPESFRYSRRLAKCKNRPSGMGDEASLIPWVLESAFGYLGEESDQGRRIYTGANWSAAIGNPFRSFGETGEGLETVLSDMRATRSEPVVFVLHLAHPRVEYTDRGKSAMVIGGAA